MQSVPSDLFWSNDGQTGLSVMMLEDMQQPEGFMPQKMG